MTMIMIIVWIIITKHFKAHIKIKFYILIIKNICIYKRVCNIPNFMCNESLCSI